MYGRGRPGGGPGGGTSALLQRASAQLRGEKSVHRSYDNDEDDDDERGLENYFSKLKKKQPTEVQWDRFDESSDNLSSEEHSVASKKTKASASTNKFMKKKKATSSADGGSESAKAAAPKPVARNTGPSQSTALHKASTFSNKYAKPVRMQNIDLSDSDLDLSLSMDDQVLADVRAMKSGKAEIQKQQTTSVKTSTAPSAIQRTPAAQPSAPSHGPFHASKPQSYGAGASNYKSALLMDSDEESSSLQIGKGGNKFMKKKVEAAPPAEYEDEIKEEIKPEKPKPQPRTTSMFATLGSAQKYSTTVALDTDEESLADFIGGLSSSTQGGSSADQSPRPPPRQIIPVGSPQKPAPRGILKTPRTPRTPTMEYISEAEEDESARYSESLAEGEEDESESSASFKLNVMDLDGLEPAMPQTTSSKSRSKNTMQQKSKPKPSERKTKQEKTAPPAKPTAADDYFSNLGLQTVDDLLGHQASDDESSASEIMTAAQSSEIKTEPESEQYESDFEPNTGRSVPASAPLRSILSPSPRPTPRLSRSRVRLSLDNVEEVLYRSRSPSPEVISTARKTSSASIVYSDDFSETEIPTSTVRTEQGSEEDYNSDYTITTSGRSSPERYTPPMRRKYEYSDYSDDFTSATEGGGTPRSVRRYSRNLSSDTAGDYYSDDYTSYTTEQPSDISRSPSPELKPPPRKSVKTKTKEIQTGLDVGLHYHWNAGPGASMAALSAEYGMAFVDPTPIATHVVSPEALETMTGYSPSVLALNDMLRQQLQLTQQFVQTQKRLHASLISSLGGQDGTALGYGANYTTMDDYKKYVKRYRKPTISFDEALKQVKEEMGIQ